MMEETPPAVVAAVREEKRWLYNLFVPAIIPSFANMKLQKPLDMIERTETVPTAVRKYWEAGQVEAMLRVEITDDAVDALFSHRSFYADHNFRAHLWGQKPGPPTIEGVSYYLLRSLAGGPGWRVINPMRVR